MENKKNNSKTKEKQMDKAQLETVKKLIESAKSNIDSALSILADPQITLPESPQTKISSLPSKNSVVASEDEAEFIEGVFDGQSMIDAEGKKYPVPANYASKSKLVAGDILKLTIQADGKFLYKQIGPVDRKNVIGILNQDGNHYHVLVNGKKYNVLLASVTYFKAKLGDEVTIIIPANEESDWACIENVLNS